MDVNNNREMKNWRYIEEDKVTAEYGLASDEFIMESYNEDKEGAQWSFYPNPTRGPLNFHFDNDDGMLYLADIHGKVLQRVPTSKRLKIDLNGYPAGTYWLKHEDAEGNWTQGQVLLVRR